MDSMILIFKKLTWAQFSIEWKKAWIVLKATINLTNFKENECKITCEDPLFLEVWLKREYIII